MELPTIRTSRELLKYASDALDLEPQMAVQIIQQNGLGGDFEADKLTEYISVLTIHSEKVQSLMRRMKEIKTINPVDRCPICGALAQRRADRDGLLRAPYGWECSAEAGHFVEVQFTKRQRAWMTKGKEVVDEDQRRDTGNDGAGSD